MRKILPGVTALMMVVCVHVHAQYKSFWAVSSEPPSEQKISSGRTQPSFYKVYSLDIRGFNEELRRAPQRGVMSGNPDLIVTFPNPDGSLQRFRVTEASIMHPDLAARYPTIKSYAGQGIDDPTATIRFSLSDQTGFHGMILSGSRMTYYIDPYSVDNLTYKVYGRESLSDALREFTCYTEAADPIQGGRGASQGRTDDKKLRKYRLALSCTAEYGNLFAGSGTDAQRKANIMAQMNVTMTRVNGVYERDLAITMEMVPNNDLIIYYGSTSADPWTNEWNSRTQQVIDAAIGSANYDIGHNFNTTGGGNAGCIGCVCVNGSKGSGYTGRSDPTGDPFDIDYVAHEMGHQFGGYHTQSNASCISGSGNTEVEPGSGSTIMGYAGICPANIQSNSDAYFHYVNIRDISANVQSGASSSCAQIINLTNNPPTANAGLNYTIPRSTPFVLRGQGSDPDGDALTYTWEQNDPQNPGSANNSAPSPTKTSGPMFRSREGTSSPNRYMPRIEDVINNNITPTWEVVPSVGRTLNFALTVRDNKAGGGQTSDDLMVVTVSGSAGPFSVTAPNTNVTWNMGQTQTVTWNVSGTNSAPVNCQNVNIKLSTDGGFTYPVTLVANTPNDGSQSVVVPNNVSSSCRIMVEAADNIFYDISNTNFSIQGAVACNPTVPTGLAASGVTANSANLSWNAVSGATYDVRYRVTGTTTWTTVNSSSNSTTLTGLASLTSYEAQVRSVCPSSSSSYSSSVTFTTTDVQLTYCTANGNNVSDEYIGRVQLGTINNITGASTGGYGDYTAISTNLTKGSAYTIIITPTWTGTVYSEGYGVWIDYNRDGDFTDSGEQVYTRSATTTTPVSGSFTVPTSAVTGSTRMRVAMRYNAIPSPCGSFNYGEVEDYTVNLGAGDTQAPTTPGNLASSGVTQTSFNLTWSASTDNVGVTGYDVSVNSTVVGSPTGTSFSVTGLSPNTTYSVSVVAKDAAGNSSSAASINVTTLPTSSGCTGGIASFPYSESFEGTIGAWSQSTSDDINWTVDSGGTPSASTGPPSATSGSFYIYTEASGSGFPNKVAILNSPCFDLTALSAATATFDYHMYGVDMGSLSLQASTNGSTWTTLWTQSGNKGNTWNTASVDLTSYTGATVSLRFVGTTGSNYRSDMALDNFVLSSGSSPGCADVALSITFDNYPEETSWAIRDNGGTIVASGGPYGSQPDGSTLVLNNCLPAGCYTFTINDSYGDGICCSYGSGSYTLTNGTTVLASGGSFGSSQTTNFCISTAKEAGRYGAEELMSRRSYVYPMPVARELNIYVPEDTEVKSIAVVTMSGLLLRQVPKDARVIDVSELASGLYVLSLETRQGLIRHKFIKE